MRRKLAKLPHKRNVNPGLFTRCKSAEAAYLLGFIWADGNVSFAGNSCRISARFVSDDEPDLWPVFERTGKWGRSYAQPTGCRKATVVYTNNRPLAEFLVAVGYRAKTTQSALAVLGAIPRRWHRHWWRGCFDGDGWFYRGKSGFQIGLCSAYAQDWAHFVFLCRVLKIHFRIDRTTRVGGRSSTARVVRRADCSRLVRYLYPHGFEFGLHRKFHKACLL